jgi:cyclopropane-fatty-acyl-phospholipid synthase
MAEPATLKSVRDAKSSRPQGARLRALLRWLVGSFERGSLRIDLPSGDHVLLEGRHAGHDAHVAVRRWRAFARVAHGGDIGFAESLGDGDCYSSDLKTLILWAIENSNSASGIGDGPSLMRLISRARHRLRANTPRRSRRNIAAHYDLGNAFYAAWLDDELSYSSGIYETPSASLAEAQATKIARVAELLELRGGERILEIGCGWGALAAHLIAEHRSHVTGLTLSIQQRDHAVARLAPFAGLSDIRLQDYRDVTDTFDRIVSIEMMEAVGEAYWPAYFDKIASCLSPDGMALLQVITIDESRYEAYRRRPDFIQLNIFPGGMLPTKAVIAAQAEIAGLRLDFTQHFGPSYARTLADWRHRFNNASAEIATLGFDDRFMRLWRYYLTYCEAGFEAGWLDVGLYRFRQAR